MGDALPLKTAGVSHTPAVAPPELANRGSTSAKVSTSGLRAVSASSSHHKPFA